MGWNATTDLHLLNSGHCKRVYTSGTRSFQTISIFPRYIIERSGNMEEKEKWIKIMVKLKQLASLKRIDCHP